MQKLMIDKKGAVDLTELAIGIVVLGITVRDTNTANGVAYNLSNSAAVGLGEYGNWFKILVITGVAAVVLGLIFMAFGRRGGPASY